MAIMEGTFHAVIGGTQEYVSGGCRLLRGDGIDARGRRGSIFVFISTGEVFLSLSAEMSVVATTKDHKFYEHGNPYGPGTDPIQGFLAEVSGSFRM